MQEPPRILLIVTGGIAAYKAAELVRELRRRGASVRVALTEGGERFVTPLTFQALSGERVHTSLLDAEAEAAMGHIELARWADAVVVAPASANFLARLAHGLADDLPTTLCLATEAPIHVAPAMNQVMWSAPATRDNLATLRARGTRVLGPGAGDQACGETGEGRMMEPTEIADALLAPPVAPAGPLAGRHVVVTAGPTREPLDPVRYLTNRSSGKMGFAVAAAAHEHGARVTLVAGPCALPTPPGVERVAVETADEMAEAVRTAHAEGMDVFIGAAAVADYRPEHVAAAKIKKQENNDSPELRLRRTPDILAEVAGSSPRPFVVGFAAETERVVEHAREKLARKGLDLIAANHVGPEAGFDRDDNRLHVLWNGGERELPAQSKTQLARALLDLIAEHYGRHRAEDP